MAENIKLSVKGKRLTITIDLSKEGTLSKSGKSMVVATTRGNVSLPDKPEFQLGLNLYKRNND